APVCVVWRRARRALWGGGGGGARLRRDPVPADPSRAKTDGRSGMRPLVDSGGGNRERWLALAIRGRAPRRLLSASPAIAPGRRSTAGARLGGEGLEVRYGRSVVEADAEVHHHGQD